MAELVRLRREATAQEQAAEDALADELHRAFRAGRPDPAADQHESGTWSGGAW